MGALIRPWGESLAIAGLAGFGAAIGVHGLVGSLDLTHVGPAILGASIFAAGLALMPRDGVTGTTR